MIAGNAQLIQIFRRFDEPFNADRVPFRPILSRILLFDIFDTVEVFEVFVLCPKGGIA